MKFFNLPSRFATVCQTISRRQRICMSFVPFSSVQFSSVNHRSSSFSYDKTNIITRRKTEKFIKPNEINEIRSEIIIIDCSFFFACLSFARHQRMIRMCEHRLFFLFVYCVSVLFFVSGQIIQSFQVKICILSLSQQFWDDKRQHSHIHIVRFSVKTEERNETHEKWTTKQSIDPIKICKRNEAEVFEEYFQVTTLNHKLTTQMKYDC